LNRESHRTTYTQADAIAAINAINAALNAEMAAAGKPLILKDLTNPATQTVIYNVPHMGGSGTVDFQTAQLLDPGPAWSLRDPIVMGPDDSHSYAKMQVVPLPGALWLLGSGIICLAVFRKKYKK
jgi:hypothetical protein